MTSTVPCSSNDSTIVTWQFSILPYKTIRYHCSSEARSSHVSVHILNLWEIGIILDTRNADPVHGMEFCFPKGNSSEKIRRDTKNKWVLWVFRRGRWQKRRWQNEVLLQKTLMIPIMQYLFHVFKDTDKPQSVQKRTIKLFQASRVRPGGRNLGQKSFSSVKW